jgi:hypothetical protein
MRATYSSRSILQVLILQSTITKFLFEQNFQPSSPSYFPQRPLLTHLQSVFVPALCQTKFHTHTKRCSGSPHCHPCVYVRALVSITLVHKPKNSCFPYKWAVLMLYFEHPLRVFFGPTVRRIFHAANDVEGVYRSIKCLYTTHKGETPPP